MATQRHVRLQRRAEGGVYAKVTFSASLALHFPSTISTHRVRSEMRKEYAVFTAALAALSPTEADAPSARECVRRLAPFLAGDGTPVLTVTDAKGARNYRFRRRPSIYSSTRWRRRGVEGASPSCRSTSN